MVGSLVPSEDGLVCTESCWVVFSLLICLHNVCMCMCVCVWGGVSVHVCVCVCGGGGGGGGR